MDSLTQFVLGSTISVLCLGKTLGPRKAALLGGALGTLRRVLHEWLVWDEPTFAAQRMNSHNAERLCGNSADTECGCSFCRSCSFWRGIFILAVSRVRGANGSHL